MNTYVEDQSVSLADSSFSEVQSISEENRAPKEPRSIASYLRVVGTLSLLGSGIVYMIQGLESVDTDFRLWVYIALSLVLSIGGIFSQKLMSDAKGARLFFALSAFVIPVQFSQLGGMVYGLFGGSADHLHAAFQFSSVGLSVTLIATGLSLLVAIPAVYSCFSVLFRSEAKRLSVSFLLFNLMILIPVRELPWGLAVIAALFIGNVLSLKIEKTDLAKHKTIEGVAVRLLMVLPLVIVMVRNAFHFDGILGASILSGSFALLLLTKSHYWINKSFQELANIFAYMLGLLSIWGISFSLSEGAKLLGFPVSEAFIIGLPVLVWTLYIAKKSSGLAIVYRIFSLLSGMAMGFVIMEENNIMELAALVPLGVAMMLCSIRYQIKSTFFLGGALSAGSLICLGIECISVDFVNGWLLLAAIGLSCVALSSVLEKYGKQWLYKGHDYMKTVNEWHF